MKLDHERLLDLVEQDLDAMSDEFPGLRDWTRSRPLPWPPEQRDPKATPPVWSALVLRRGREFVNVFSMGASDERRRREGRGWVTIPASPAKLFVGNEEFPVDDMSAVYAAILSRVGQR